MNESKLLAEPLSLSLSFFSAGICCVLVWLLPAIRRRFSPAFRRFEFMGRALALCVTKQQCHPFKLPASSNPAPRPCHSDSRTLAFVWPIHQQRWHHNAPSSITAISPIHFISRSDDITTATFSSLHQPFLEHDRRWHQHSSTVLSIRHGVNLMTSQQPAVNVAAALLFRVMNSSCQQPAFNQSLFMMPLVRTTTWRWHHNQTHAILTFPLCHTKWLAKALSGICSFFSVQH